MGRSTHRRAGSQGEADHRRSCCALGACLLVPDFESVRPDRAMGMGYKLMSTWLEAGASA